MLKSLFDFGGRKSAPRETARDGLGHLDPNATESDLHERGILIDQSFELADAFCMLLPVFERAAIFSPNELAEVEKAVREFERQREKVFGS